jgi:hypothetical protein
MEPFKQTLRERGMDRGTEPHARVSNKRFELLKEADPHIVRVAVIYNPLNSGHELAVVAIEAAAKTLKIRIQRLAVRAPADFDAVFPVMTPQRVDAVTIVEDAMIHSYALRVVDVALKRRVPAVFGLSILVEAGGFISYGPNRAELWHKAALLTDKILRGAKPGDLPVEQPTKFELVVNLKTARTLGLTSPQSLLLKGAKPADLPVEQPTKFEFVINLKTVEGAWHHYPPLAPATGGWGHPVAHARRTRPAPAGSPRFCSPGALRTAPSTPFAPGWTRGQVSGTSAWGCTARATTRN